MVASGDTTGQDIPTSDDGRGDALADSLLFLLGDSSNDGKRHMNDGYSSTPSAGDIGGALNELTSLEHVGDRPQVRLSTKVSVLFALAQRGYPGLETNPDQYQLLAQAINPELDPQVVLDDFRAAVDDPSSLQRSATANTLALHDLAFLGDDCTCNTASVTVNGKRSSWIYSEFDTDASLDAVIEWMQPVNWPTHSPLLFKGMEQTVPPTSIPGGPDNWHATYIEAVSLPFNTLVETSLHFDFITEAGAFAAMSYVLDNVPGSIGDGVINVDRGFLSVNELGSHRHVKALKIVGFTDDRTSTDLALTVCPFWTEFVKGAVEQEGDGGLVPTYASCTGDADEAIADFQAFATDAFADYVHQGTRWARAAAAPGYCIDDLTQDSAAAWLQLAQTWTNAWAHGFEVLSSVAGESTVFHPPERSDFPTGFRPGRPVGSDVSFGSVRPAQSNRIETITIPIAGLSAGATCNVTDFVRAGTVAATIPASDIDVEVVSFGAAPDGVTTNGVRLTVDTQSLREGIYCGHISHSTQGALITVPMHFYVSHAVRS